MAKKNCSLWLICAVILLLITQGYFMTKVLSPKIPNLNRDSSTFLTTTLDTFIFKKAYIDVDHNSAQEDKRDESLDSYKPHADKPVAVNEAGRNNLEKVVDGLPQKRTALQHHPAQENEPVVVDGANKNNLEKVATLSQKKVALRHHPAQEKDTYKPVDGASKSNLEKVVHRLPQKKVALPHHSAQENEILDAYKPVAVDGASKSNLVHGLLQKQKKAALQHHHLKRRHFNLSLLFAKYLADNDPGPLVETDDTLTPRPLTANEQAGNNILFTLRTTMKYHEQRLPVLFDTWLTTVNTSNVFLVTDGGDTKWKGRAGLKYIDVPCHASYQRNDLCCKAGTELSLMFRDENLHYDWLCHVDDDIYVLLRSLVEQLSKFRPREEPIYFGRSGSAWTIPRAVIHGAKYGKPGQKYHFAVGGMYCLSRAMLELAKPYLVGGQEFANSCSNTLEPEDVTVGVVVGVLLNQNLSRTEMIYTHGLGLWDATKRLQKELDEKIAYAYGWGAINWGAPGTFNHIAVPQALYSEQEDKTQFYSLHCFLYPSLPRCTKKARDNYIKRRKKPK